MDVFCNSILDNIVVTCPAFQNLKSVSPQSSETEFTATLTFEKLEAWAAIIKNCITITEKIGRNKV